MFDSLIWIYETLFVLNVQVISVEGEAHNLKNLSFNHKEAKIFKLLTTL